LWLLTKVLLRVLQLPGGIQLYILYMPTTKSEVAKLK